MTKPLLGLGIGLVLAVWIAAGIVVWTDADQEKDFARR